MTDASPTPAPFPPSTGAADLDEAKKRAEIEKLACEAMKIRADLRNADRAFRFERWKTLGSLITALVAIVGLFLTLRAQQLSSEAESRRRENDDLIAALRQYGEGSDSGRLAAVTSLESYLQSSQDQHRDRVVQLLVSALELEANAVVRSQIRGALRRNPSGAVVAALKQRNLQLQEQLMDADKLLPEDFDLWELKQSDSEPVQRIAREIEENGKTIVDVLNAIHARDGRIHGLDLSGILFSMPTISGAGGSFGWSPRLTLDFAKGIRFEQVDLSGSKLSWLTFDNCEFTDTNLDRTRLVQTRFRKCSFQGSTSIADYVASFRVAKTVYPESQRFVGPVFEASTLEIETLYPQDLGFARHPFDAVLTFENSRWALKRLPVDVAPRLHVEAVGRLEGGLQAGSGGFRAVPIGSVRLERLDIPADTE